MKQNNHQIPELDLDALLNFVSTLGSGTDDEAIKEFFQKGSFDNEPYLIQAIEKHLQTEDQRKAIYDAHLSIEKILNGRFGDDHSNLITTIFTEWNAKIGFIYFHF